jgi:hypothetical protein
LKQRFSAAEISSAMDEWICRRSLSAEERLSLHPGAVNTGDFDLVSTADHETIMMKHGFKGPVILEFHAGLDSS